MIARKDPLEVEVLRAVRNKIQLGKSMERDNSALRAVSAFEELLGEIAAIFEKHNSATLRKQ